MTIHLMKEILASQLLLTLCRSRASILTDQQLYRTIGIL